MSDARSSDAVEWRRWYNRAAWQRLRLSQLHRQPLCERCLEAGRVEPATVVNHRVPHRGDWARFTDPANLESCCKPHHDSVVQAEEVRGYSAAVDDTGWPADPQHPANRPTGAQRADRGAKVRGASDRRPVADPFF